MDIIKGYKSSVKFPVPSDLSAATATIYKDDVQIGSPSAAVVVDGVATVQIPYKVVKDSGVVKVHLAFTYETVAQTLDRIFNVIKPYLELYALRDILGIELTDDELWAAEGAARYIINAHCGQSFDYTHKTINAFGKDTNSVSLPERLDILEKISFNGILMYDIDTALPPTFLGDTQFIVVGDGWFIKRPYYPYIDIKADINTQMYVSGVIYDPFSYGQAFACDYPYAVTGFWGYSDIPVNVVQAMKLLVKDYACSDEMYRDRFIESVQTPNWQIAFNDGAWINTGNVRADYLLAPYVKNNWLVV